MYRVAYRSVCSQDDAMDVVQNTFISFWSNRAKLRPNGSVNALLFTILKNNIINFYRKQNMHRMKLGTMSTVSEEISSSEESLYAKELLAQIHGQVELLPGRMQQIFILSRQEHMSVSEISERLNIAPRTVKNQLSNALKILRSRLSVIRNTYFF
jgi:RNA polymerase sigma-70 factor (ECF subfamily)